MYERPVGVELLGGVAAVVCELFDQVLVSVTQFVFGHSLQAEIVLGEVLDEILQCLIGICALLSTMRCRRYPQVASDSLLRSRETR
jgi:hypothetical protein